MMIKRERERSRFDAAHIGNMYVCVLILEPSLYLRSTCLHPIPFSYASSHFYFYTLSLSLYPSQFISLSIAFFLSLLLRFASISISSSSIFFARLSTDNNYLFQILEVNFSQQSKSLSFFFTVCFYTVST